MTTNSKHTHTRGLPACAALAAVAAIAVVVSVAAADPSATLSCRTVPVRSTFGGHIEARSQLARIRGGKVLALNANTTAKTMIRFTGRSGRWLTSTTGTRYALAGQTLTRDGRPGGVYLIAARVRKDRSVPCAVSRGPVAFKSDTAGRTASPGNSIVGEAIPETAGSAHNHAQLLRNESSQRVCTNTQTHPDGAPRVSNPFVGIWCYQGPGAWLNNEDGRERWSDQDGNLVVGPAHYVSFNNASVPGAKRPNAKPNGEAILNSPILWRAYSPNFHNPPGV